MSKTDKELLEDIKLALKALDKYELSLIIENFPPSFEMLAQKLYNLIEELHNTTLNEDLKEKCYHSMLGLKHTIGKEVVWVTRARQESLKKNAAKKRETEFKMELYKAIKQISFDTIMVISFELSE